MRASIAAVCLFIAAVVASTIAAAPESNLDLAVARPNNPLEVFPCEGSRRYLLTIKYIWSGATHPGAYPSNGQFSPLVAASHSSFFTMWAPTDYPSRGVQNVAETGNTAALLRELGRELGRDVLAVESTDEPTEDGTQTVRLRLRVDAGRSRISAISMLFPSPDWFTGVDGIDVCNAETGRWIREAHGDLSVWDAGTDRGRDFDSANRPLNNVRPIVSILGTRFGGIPVGMWTITRL